MLAPQRLESSSAALVDISLQNPLPGKIAPPAPFLARTEHCNICKCRNCERQYDRPGMCVVLSGLMDYRSELGAGMGVPGAVFFANAGEFFQGRHLDDRDLRRLVVWYDTAFLAEIADSYGVAEPRFRAVTLQPGKAAASFFGRMQALARGWSDSLETAAALAVSGLTLPDEAPREVTISTRDRRRILSTVAYIEQSYSEPCAIDTLAFMGGMSRFHFMRLFKAVTGLSPNQYVINVRLRAAAERIADSNTPISEIALTCGFNDISHFNTSFRAMFGCTPRQVRV